MRSLYEKVVIDMSCRSLGCVLLGIVLLLTAGCPNTSKNSVSTAEQEQGLRVVCSSGSVDSAYLQDFCVNTAHGIWSTTF